MRMCPLACQVQFSSVQFSSVQFSSVQFNSASKCTSFIGYELGYESIFFKKIEVFGTVVFLFQFSKGNKEENKLRLESELDSVVMNFG